MPGSSRWQLSLVARNLKNAAGLLNKSDPFAVVSILRDNKDGEGEPLGQTEVVYNNLNPDWSGVFIIDGYRAFRPFYFEVGIYDLNQKEPVSGGGSSVDICNGSTMVDPTSCKCMGTAIFEVGEIIGKRGNVASKALAPGGAVYVRLERSEGSGSGHLSFQIRGSQLPNMHTDLRKRRPSPYFEILRKEETPREVVWNNIFRSKVAKSNPNPDWEEVYLDMEILCNGDLDRGLKIVVIDHSRRGKHKIIGEVETTVNRFVHARTNGTNSPLDTTFQLSKDGSQVGQIVVVKAELSEPINTRASGSSSSTDPTLRTSNVKQNLMPLPQFVHYIEGECDISLSVAIDFTSANGDPREAGTPHYIGNNANEENSEEMEPWNDYARAIDAVGSILANYDSDQKFPVWGFGIKYGERVLNCFQCGQENEVHGVNGILETYRSMFNGPLSMVKPCVFSEVIDNAAKYAKQKYKEARENGRLAYSVLLILTVGNLSDIMETKEALRKASEAPLSVVIVGIGQGDFAEMQFLDDFADMDKDSGRDITQFVKFDDHHNVRSLSDAVLEEIPDQVVEFFYVKNGIEPGTAQNLDYKSVHIQPADQTKSPTKRKMWSRFPKAMR